MSSADSSPHNQVSYREALGPDEQVLRELHYVATYYSAYEQGEPLPSHIFAELDPAYNRYYKEWGRPGDTGVIAGDAAAGRTVGAAWFRTFEPHEQPDGVAMARHELSIAVVPDYHGRGIGKTLLQKLMAAARYQGIEALSLGVSEHNERALRLYRSAGFVVVGRHQTDLIMEANLSDGATK